MVALTCAEASNPGASGNSCPACRFQIHSTHELLAALSVFYTQSPNTQYIHSPWKGGTSHLAPSAASGSLLNGRPAASVTESDCQVVSGCGDESTESRPRRGCLSTEPVLRL